MRALNTGLLQIGLLLAHGEGDPPLDTGRLFSHFTAEGMCGLPNWIGSADTIRSLEVAMSLLLEHWQYRIPRVRVYPELAILRKQRQFGHLTAFLRVIDDALGEFPGLSFALAITDNCACLEQVWSWIGTVPKARECPEFKPGHLVLMTLVPRVLNPKRKAGEEKRIVFDFNDIALQDPLGTDAPARIAPPRSIPLELELDADATREFSR